MSIWDLDAVDRRIKKIYILIYAFFFHVAVSNAYDDSAKLLLPSNWLACKTQKGRSGQEYADSRSNCIHAIVPGTILRSLLNNASFIFDDPYVSTKLRGIPDVFETGHDFYSYTFINDFRLSPASLRNRIILAFDGINYNATIYLNNHLVGKTAKGMFQRHLFEISDFVNYAGTNTLSVSVSPPDHVGFRGGQGGNHLIARNGAITQYAAGWDWIYSTPDRNTGIWDDVQIQYTGDLYIYNAVIHTLNINPYHPSKSLSMKHTSYNATQQLEIVINNYAIVSKTGYLIFTIAEEESTLGSNPTVVFRKKYSININSLSRKSFHFPHFIISNAKLWWPHTHGIPYLYKITIDVFVDSMDVVSHSIGFYHGIRVIQRDIHPLTKGSYFIINHIPIFLMGGNWIATDQFLRYSNGLDESKRRYEDEVRMHMEMGLNLIRVWGGGLAERNSFYDVCDRLGILVIQEVRFILCHVM